MAGTVIRNLEKEGLKAALVPAVHVADLKNDIFNLREKGLLDDGLYDDYIKGFVFDLDEGVESILIVSESQPITKLYFTTNSRTVPVVLPPTYLNGQAGEIVEKTLAALNHRFIRVRLPLKLLAVRSGLGRYGRNNICYVPGFGSFHRLLAFATSVPVETDPWQEPTLQDICTDCDLCVSACPTNAISHDRWLVFGEKCITYFNENDPPFPDWIVNDWHNALIGCMHCQRCCPANREHVDRIEEGARFSKEETDLIFQGVSFEELPMILKTKLTESGIDSYFYYLVKRNFEVLAK